MAETTGPGSSGDNSNVKLHVTDRAVKIYAVTPDVISKWTHVQLKKRVGSKTGTWDAPQRIS